MSTGLLHLSEDLPSEVLPAGGLLIAEGDRHDRMFVLVRGLLTVERDGVVVARIDAPGAVFGEMSAVLDRPATATVRAVSETEVRVVADPLAFLSERPGAAVAVLRITAGRLDALTQYLVDVKQQFAEHGDHLGLVDGILGTLVHHQGPAARTGSARDPEG